MEAGRGGRGAGRGGGRGSQWRRGGSAGIGDNTGTGERRARGRGGRYRSRGKRDHYRGRGRAHPGDGAADLFRRRHDEQNNEEEIEEETPDVFSRRKLESNWDRYEESEKAEADDDVPAERGTDYNVLLSSAGDSFTQFRFSEEKDWEMDSLAANQVPALFVDLESLAQSLQELPLHKRLNLEPDLVQASTPVELPSVGTLHRVDPKVPGGFKAPAPAHAGQEPDLGVTRPVKPVPGISLSSHTSTTVISAADDADEELDLLLGLQKPITEISHASNAAGELPTDSEKELKAEIREEDLVEVRPANAKEEMRNQQKGEESEQKADSVKQELTEEDLEDWLDSMIS
ncbi:cell death regulator Aven isoform X2 [Trichomycterus rosablanca]|uniref:cell death regulator Aven isoform X2 n=1 Tax=Trichomycterus rosablanca TaxID=2290929 RepID=UPI002F36004B